MFCESGALFTQLVWNISAHSFYRTEEEEKSKQKSIEGAVPIQQRFVLILSTCEVWTSSNDRNVKPWCNTMFVSERMANTCAFIRSCMGFTRVAGGITGFWFDRRKKNVWQIRNNIVSYEKRASGLTNRHFDFVTEQLPGVCYKKSYVSKRTYVY